MTPVFFTIIMIEIVVGIWLPVIACRLEDIAKEMKRANDKAKEARHD